MSFRLERLSIRSLNTRPAPLSLGSADPRCHKRGRRICTRCGMPRPSYLCAPKNSRLAGKSSQRLEWMSKSAGSR
jgi:hypothetical protein